MIYGTIGNVFQRRTNTSGIGPSFSSSPSCFSPLMMTCFYSHSSLLSILLYNQYILYHPIYSIHINPNPTAPFSTSSCSSTSPNTPRTRSPSPARSSSPPPPRTRNSSHKSTPTSSHTPHSRTHSTPLI